MGSAGLRCEGDVGIRGIGIASGLLQLSGEHAIGLQQTVDVLGESPQVLMRGDASVRQSSTPIEVAGQQLRRSPHQVLEGPRQLGRLSVAVTALITRATPGLGMRGRARRGAEVEAVAAFLDGGGGSKLKDLLRVPNGLPTIIKPRKCYI